MPHPFCTAIGKYLETIAQRLSSCLHSVDEEKLWSDFAQNLSSPGNLVLHLTGNLNQYVLKTLGNKTFYRERSKEFSAKPDTSKEKLLEMFEATVRECIAVIDSLSDEQLSRTYKVQGFEYTGYEVLIHATEHLSHHTGQFVWFCKYLFNSDIDFYKGQDLNVQ